MTQRILFCESSENSCRVDLFSYVEFIKSDTTIDDSSLSSSQRLGHQLDGASSPLNLNRIDSTQDSLDTTFGFRKSSVPLSVGSGHDSLIMAKETSQSNFEPLDSLSIGHTRTRREL